MCFVGYCQDDLDYAAECRKLKAFGFDRALVYPGRFNTYHQDFEMGGKPPIDMPGDTIAAIRELGFDVAPWSWLNEALDDGSDAIRSIYRRNRAGEQKPMWVIEKQQWYEVCSSAVPDFQRRVIAGSMGPWPFWPVPLTMLVFHGSMIPWCSTHSSSPFLWHSCTGGSADASSPISTF